MCQHFPSTFSLRASAQFQASATSVPAALSVASLTAQLTAPSPDACCSEGPSTGFPAWFYLRRDSCGLLCTLKSLSANHDGKQQVPQRTQHSLQPKASLQEKNGPFP